MARRPFRPKGYIRMDLPIARGMTVGLFGGSFDPPHEGHAHVAETALEQLHLDRIIWLVSTQNPLKSAAPASLAQRLLTTRKLARGPRMFVTDIESRLGARYTLDTLEALTRRYPGVSFVWIMGSDNVRGFHRWQGWRTIAAMLPIAVVPRPGVGHQASKASRAINLIRLHGPLNSASSTALRARARVAASVAAQGV